MVNVVFGRSMRFADFQYMNFLRFALLQRDDGKTNHGNRIEGKRGNTR